MGEHAQVCSDITSSRFDVRRYAGTVRADDNLITDPVRENVVVLLERVDGGKILVKERCSPLWR